METFVNVESTKNLFKFTVILSNRGPTKDIVWDQSLCTPKLQQSGGVYYGLDKILIEDRTYTLRNRHPKYERKSKSNDTIPDCYYFVKNPLQSFVLNNLAGFWLEMVCECGRKSDPNVPHFTLSTPPFDVNESPQKKWKCEIDTRSIIYKGWGCLNFIMVLFDILLWIPAAIFSGLMVYAWLLKLVLTGKCRQQTQESCQHEPVCVIFDENEAIQYFRKIRLQQK